jgi:hypothetical protein
MATLYKSSGEILEVSPENGTNFGLREVQELVDGYVELLSLDQQNMILMDEEGKCRHKPVNINASKLVAERTGVNYCLVGDVLLCAIGEFR